jgi:hypothetical protein
VSLSLGRQNGVSGSGGGSLTSQPNSDWGFSQMTAVAECQINVGLTQRLPRRSARPAAAASYSSTCCNWQLLLVPCQQAHMACS